MVNFVKTKLGIALGCLVTFNTFGMEQEPAEKRVKQEIEEKKEISPLVWLAADVVANNQRFYQGRLNAASLPEEVLSHLEASSILHVYNCRASKREISPLLYAFLIRPEKDILNFLTRRNPDVTFQDAEGKNALYHAVKLDMYNVARELIARKLSPNHKVSSNRTAYEIAYDKNDPRMIEILKESGEEPVYSEVGRSDLRNILNWYGDDSKQFSFSLR